MDHLYRIGKIALGRLLVVPCQWTIAAAQSAFDPTVFRVFKTGLAQDAGLQPIRGTYCFPKASRDS